MVTVDYVFIIVAIIIAACVFLHLVQKVYRSFPRHISIEGVVILLVIFHTVAPFSNSFIIEVDNLERIKFRCLFV